MKRRVICQLSYFAPEYAGSFVDSLLSLARYCRETFDVETICVFPQRAEKRVWIQRFQNEGVAVAFIPPTANTVVFLMHLLKDRDTAIFASHFFTYDVSAMILKLARFRNSKLIWHFHSIAPMTVKQRLKDGIKVKCLARWFGDLFIAVGDGAYKNALERGFPAERVFLSPNGVDLKRFSMGDKNRKEARALLGVSDEQFVFLLLGYNPLIKGEDVFVKAADELRSNGRKSDIFVIVAREETRQFVARMPEAARLGSALRIIDPVQDFKFLLDGIDVLVAASRMEGFAYAVVEAMAAAKPILCSDIPGVRDSYAGAEGVWVFPSEDWKSLASLMLRMRELSQMERSAFGDLNSKYVGARYSLEAWAKNVGDIYNTLLQPSATGLRPLSNQH